MRFLLVPAALLASFIFTTGASAAGEPIMPLSDVTVGMSCSAKTVFQGTTPQSFPVTVKDIYHDTTGDFLLVEVGGAASSTGIAAGMSGSPVYCPVVGGGEAFAGALSYSIGWENDQVGLATPIETMIGEVPTNNAASKAMPASLAKKVEGVRAFPLLRSTTGMSPSAIAILNKRNPRLNLIQGSSVASSITAASDSELNPGDSVGVAFINGDISSGGVGTVSYRDGSRIWAFGHPLAAVGNSSLFLTTAPVTTIVDAGPSSIFGSYKLATIGPNIGVLDNDSFNSISGVLNQQSAQTEAVANFSGSAKNVTLRSSFADEAALGYPHGNSVQDYSGAMAVTAADKAAGGYVPRWSGSVCWEITVRSIKDPFRFCKRAVANTPADFTGTTAWEMWLAENEYLALNEINSLRSANLDVSRVAISAKTSNNYQVAKLVSAKQSSANRKGQVTIALRAKTPEGTFITSSIKVSGIRKKTKLTIAGSPGVIKSNQIITNDRNIFDTPRSDSSTDPGSDSLDFNSFEPAANVAELRDRFAQMSGSTRVKVRGLRGGQQTRSINLSNLLPVGGVHLTVR